MSLLKYIYSLSLVVLSGFLLVACEDFLDRQEDEKLTFEKIWESRNTTKQYWLNAMSFLPKENAREIGNDDPYIGASDEGSIAFERNFRAMNFGSWNPSSIPYYKMDYYYKGIRECNIFMLIGVQILCWISTSWLNGRFRPVLPEHIIIL